MRRFPEALDRPPHSMTPESIAELRAMSHGVATVAHELTRTLPEAVEVIDALLSLVHPDQRMSAPVAMAENWLRNNRAFAVDSPRAPAAPAPRRNGVAIGATQQRVLDLLRERPNGCTVGEVAATFPDVLRGNLDRALVTLGERGLATASSTRPRRWKAA